MTLQQSSSAMPASQITPQTVVTCSIVPVGTVTPS